MNWFLGMILGFVSMLFFKPDQVLDADSFFDKRGGSEIVKPKLSVPLNGNFSSGSKAIPVPIGAYRFVKLNNRIGYQPLERSSHLKFTSDIPQKKSGSIVLWIAPLESLDVATIPSWVSQKDTNSYIYNLISDGLPINNPDISKFAWSYFTHWFPAMTVKFTKGRPNSDFSLPPYIVVEHLPLKEKHWYQLVFTWNKAEHRMRMYINGILSGVTDFPFTSPAALGNEFYLGNTAMAFSGLEIYDEELSTQDLKIKFNAGSSDFDPGDVVKLKDLLTVKPRSALNWKADATWNKAYSNTFKEKKSNTAWQQQGCDTKEFSLLKNEITSDGWLIQTPDTIAHETRVYFWSPQNFEGDIAIKYDFRPEQNTGLALLVALASGMQREDFITNWPKRNTGRMSTIVSDNVRNYHWEFFRKVNDVRSDLGTQVLIKNPYRHPLDIGAIQPYEIGKWYTLSFLKEGNRIRCAINNVCVMDVEDNPSNNNGPVLNFGRLGLRLMYKTKMTFRNMEVWTKNDKLTIVQE